MLQLETIATLSLITLPPAVRSMGIVADGPPRLRHRLTESTDCDSLPWHPEPGSSDGCSNSPTYPPEWEGIKDLFWPDYQSCCDWFRPNDPCKKYDHCEGGAPGTTTTTSIVAAQCKSNQWHPSMTNKDGCSNGVDDFPLEWLHEGTLDYFFDTAEGCCDFFFGVADLPCKIYKLCEEAPSETTTTTTSTSLHTVAPTTDPTQRPTYRPTTRSPTEYPTESPTTALPSASPTTTPRRYYQVFSTGICTELDVFTPYWMTESDFFLDYTECCEKSWNTEPCMAARPEGACCTPAPTRRPSKSPTTEPTIKKTDEPTAFPTGLGVCPEATWWHPSEDFSRCTNAPGYDPNWDSPPSNKYYLHKTLSSCCLFFEEGLGEGCVYEDICSVLEMAESTTKPSNSPTAAKEACNPAKWHPSEDMTKCTNSHNFPSQWSTSAHANSMLFDTAAACCQTFFFARGATCEIDDICAQDINPYAQSGPTNSPTDAGLSALCEEASEYWHPTSDKARCSNSMNYPEIWNHKSLASSYLHSTADSCCELWAFSFGNSCILEDVCASTMINESSSSSTTTTTTTSMTDAPDSSAASESLCGQKWHPSSRYDACTNSNSYPSFWDTMSTYYLFDSAQSCCLKLYKNDSQYVKDCQIIEACSGQSFTLGALGSHDIGSNSSGTTSSSSVSTTSSTSADPNIDAPCALSIWHPSLDFKRCTNEPNWPNSWNSMQDQYLHDSSSSCCDVFFNSPCYVEDTCSGTISTITAENPTPTKCEELRYHPTTDFTSCTNDPSFPESWTWSKMAPNYMFDSAKSCCDRYLFVEGKDCPVSDVCSGKNDIIELPTDSPSSAPIKLPCGSRLFHPSTDFTMCSNSLDYPEDWSNAVQFMFESYESCCQKYFWAEGKDCVLEDTCLGSVETVEEPTDVPTNQPSILPCKKRFFHPKPEDFSTCSNDLNYPSSWKEGQYLLSTAGECCGMFAGEGCTVINDCDGTTTFVAIDEPTTTTEATTETTTATASASTLEVIDCTSNPYHPSSGFKQCTNSPIYPGSWDLPNMSAHYLHANAYSCCELWAFSYGNDCVVEDFCAQTKITIKMPTPSPSNMQTSKPTMPSPSRDPTEQPTEHPVTSAPSSQAPSKSPTDSPSAKPTPGTPTDKPIIPPTTSPTKVKWYPDRNINYSEGRCITTLPVPQFRDTYDTLRECCESAYAGQSSGACMSEEETKTSSTITILQFYSNPSNGICAIVGESTPSWITTFYTDWSECCKAGWKYDECMAENPLQSDEEDTLDDEETSATSSTTTVLQFYSNPSNGMCAVVDESTPSWITTFYTDWSECCKVGWKYDECLAENPIQLEAVQDIESTTTSSSTTSETTSTVDPCRSLLWHPITAEKHICTNSESYPPTWNDPALKDKYLFSSAKDCCRKLYKNSSCEIVDTCS